MPSRWPSLNSRKRHRPTCAIVLGAYAHTLRRWCLVVWVCMWLSVRPPRPGCSYFMLNDDTVLSFVEAYMSNGTHPPC